MMQGKFQRDVSKNSCIGLLSRGPEAVFDSPPYECAFADP